MNKYDEKQREEVGVKDMENYPYGGVEIEETLTNGVLLYVPYGILVDWFKAMDAGSRALGHLNDDMKDSIRELESNPSETNSKVIEMHNHTIKAREKHQYVLDKVYPVVEEV